MTEEDSSGYELNRTGPHELNRRDSELDRPRTRTTTASAAGWLLLLAGVILLVLLWGNFRDGDAAGSVSAAGIQELRLNTGSTRVEFAHGDTGEIEVELTGRTGSRQLEVQQSGSTLNIRVSRSWWLPGLFSFGGSTVLVTFPEELEPALHVNASSGRVELSDLTLRGLTVAASSGRVCLQELTVRGDLRVSTSSGRVCLQDSEVSGATSISTTSGAITVTDSTAGSFSFNLSSGRLEATGLPGTELTARTSSGRIDLEAITMLGDWNLQTSSGRVRVELDEPPANLAIDFQGSSGRWSVADRYGLDVAAGGGNHLQARTGTGGPELRVRTSSGSFSLD